MKKWFLLAIVLLGCFTARAQSRYYFGGDISFTTNSSGTSVVVYPEFGRRISQYLRVGVAAGFDWNNIRSDSDFSMGFIPHIRGYLPLVGRFGLSGDTFLSARWTRREGHEPLISTQYFGFRPGLYIPLGSLILSAQIGILGWYRTNDGYGNANSQWIARLDSRDIIIGVLFNL